MVFTLNLQKSPNFEFLVQDAGKEPGDQHSKGSGVASCAQIQTSWAGIDRGGVEDVRLSL